MIEIIKKLFGFGNSVDYKELLKKGAVIIDVRTEGEFKTGNIKKSVNIPLGNISNNLSKIPKNIPIITCCASGIRSASAKSILKSNGYDQVYNGGSWASLNSKI